MDTQAPFFLVHRNSSFLPSSTLLVVGTSSKNQNNVSFRVQKLHIQLSNCRRTFFPGVIIQSGLLDCRTWNLKSQGQNYQVVFGCCVLVSGRHWNYPGRAKDFFSSYAFSYHCRNTTYKWRSKHSRASSYYSISSFTYSSIV